MGIKRRAAAFLDRDGVLNRRPRDHEYVRTARDFRWCPGAREAVARLADRGFVPIIVSNQRGVARGLVAWSVLEEIEEKIQHDLAQHGTAIRAFYYCPHDLKDDCDCRKPAPGLILRAAAEQRIDLSRSVLIGDTQSDMEAGRAAGCLTVMVGRPKLPTSADLIAPDLLGASSLLIARFRRPGMWSAEGGFDAGRSM